MPDNMHYLLVPAPPIVLAVFTSFLINVRTSRSLIIIWQIEIKSRGLKNLKTSKYNLDKQMDGFGSFSIIKCFH